MRDCPFNTCEIWANMSKTASDYDVFQITGLGRQSVVALIQDRARLRIGGFST